MLQHHTQGCIYVLWLYEPGVVAQTSKPYKQETEVGRLSLRIAQTTWLDPVSKEPDHLQRP